MSNPVLLSPPPTIPPHYKKPIQDFLDGLYRHNMWWLAQSWGYDAPKTVLGPQQLLQTLIAERLATIARYAAGEDLPAPYVADSIQGVLEHLFGQVPDLPLIIPSQFWQTPVGWMILQAQLRLEGDELLTLTQASEQTGIPVKRLSGMIREGRLRAVKDPNAKNPRHATRVFRSEIEQLRR